MIQKMIIYALSSLELSGKYFSTSPPWYFDFATSNHMKNNVKSLTNVDKYFENLKIYTIDSFFTYHNNCDVSSSLTDVFFSPSLATILVFVC